MEVITLLAYFNTSHVTVYLFWWIHYRVQIIFQYISCYCLSLNTSSVLIPFLISIHLMLLFMGFALYESGNTMVFQYISCYCLSQPPICILLCKSSFQYISCYCLSTHHLSIHNRNRISIHLMLLFINCYIVNCLLCSIFQYISCYCLSQKKNRTTV